MATHKTKPPAKSVTRAATNPVVVSEDYAVILAEYKEIEAEREKIIGDWANRLKATSKKMFKLNAEYKRILLKYLQEAYVVYQEVSKHDLADDFYANLRGYLYSIGIKTQSNTPDASLLIRYVCGTHITTKSVSDYSRVLQAANFNNIAPESFIEWVEAKTMTKVIEDQRAIENNIETRAERMDRARRVIMRLIEVRETKPEFSWVTTTVEAEKKISRNGFWISLGNATRRLGKAPPEQVITSTPMRSQIFDQAPDGFYADMNLIMMLPMNPEMERRILNIYASEIVDAVEYYEEQINTLEEKVWADDLWERLVSAGHEESLKQDEYWSNRQQAARFEDQQEFVDKVIKPKKNKGNK